MKNLARREDDRPAWTGRVGLHVAHSAPRRMRTTGAARARDGEARRGTPRGGCGSMVNLNPDPQLPYVKVSRIGSMLQVGDSQAKTHWVRNRSVSGQEPRTLVGWVYTQAGMHYVYKHATRK